MSVAIKKFGAGQPETLTEFATLHGLVIEVLERSRVLGSHRYCASLERVEIMDRSCLIGAHGNGSSPDEAMAAYARELAGRRIAIDAYKPERREIDVPNNFHHEVRP